MINYIKHTWDEFKKILEETNNPSLRKILWTKFILRELQEAIWIQFISSWWSIIIKFFIRKSKIVIFSSNLINYDTNIKPDTVLIGLQDKYRIFLWNFDQNGEYIKTVFINPIQYKVWKKIIKNCHIQQEKNMSTVETK